MTPSIASANVLPIVGCPAIGSSSPGVKIRIRTSPPRSGGKMNVDSEKAISLAMRCICVGGQSLRLGKHGELIAFEAAIGEDVEVEVSEHMDERG